MEAGEGVVGVMYQNLSQRVVRDIRELLAVVLGDYEGVALA